MAGTSDVVTMSSKGQVVVPRAVREAVDADAGTEFIVYGSGDTIVFKKIIIPKFSAKQLEQLVTQAEKKLVDAGFLDEASRHALVKEAVERTRQG